LIPTFVSSSTHTELSPRFFPRLATILLGGLSFLLMTSSYKALKKSEASNPLAGLFKYKESFSFSWSTVVVLFCLGVYFLLFEYVGFLFATPPVAMALMWFFGQRNPLRVVLIGLVLTGVLYSLFTYGLKVPLG
jgi:multidrug transporter EmrE-like cation transporter